MNSEGIKIGELVKRTGVTRATVHHYVREGLLPEPVKTSRNMALYDPSCVDRVLLIKGLQAHTRRPLADVKAVLAGAEDHEGIQRLRDQLELEAARAEASPLNPDASRDAITLRQLSERTGFDAKALRSFEDIGVISAHGGRYRPTDVAVVDALARLTEAGFDEAHGFQPEHIVIYLEAMRELLHKEVGVFLQTQATGQDPAELLALAERGIERVTPLMMAIRRKLIRELIEAAPLPK